MPLGEERSVTRQSIIGSLLQVINYNQSRNMKDVHLYEFQQHIQKVLNYKTLRLHVLVNTMGFHLNKFHTKQIII